MTSESDNIVTVVDDMLLDAGCGQDAELRDVLLSLGTLASLPAPAPTGELAALLAADGPPAAAGAVPGGREVAGADPQKTEQAGGEPTDDLARRRGRHRSTTLGLVLVAGMGLGVGGVAASSTTPGSSVLEHVLEDWTRWSGPAGGPAAAGYSGPAVATDRDVARTTPAPAPGSATEPANLASRLLRDPAGLSGRAPACPSPVRHDGGIGSGKCAAGGAGVPPQGSGAGVGDSSGVARADGTPAVPGTAGAAKTEAPASNKPAGGGDASGASAQKAAGSPGNADPAADQGQSQEAGSLGGGQGNGQGNGQKSAAPAK